MINTQPNAEKRYPDHHEGVTGIARDEDDAILTASGSLMACEMTGTLYTAVLVGNPAPVVHEILLRMTQPRVGDRVVVIDATYRNDVDGKRKGSGYLVVVREEWGNTQAEWAEDLKDDASLSEADRFVEKSAWYIQYGPNPADICRWTNCMVVSIPRRSDFR